MTDEISEKMRAEVSAPEKLLTHRQYLTRRAVYAGADIWTAIEAVSSTLIEHPEINWDEEKTEAQWDAEHPTDEELS